MNIRFIGVLLFILSPILGQSQTSYTETRSQTDYLIDIAPINLLTVPREMSYRILRNLGLDDWSETMQSPEVRSMLYKHTWGRMPFPPSTFPFENFDEDFEDVVVREFGVCSGFATIQRNFNLLLHFDPENAHEQKIPKNGTPAFYNFYNGLLKKAASLQPVIIPAKKDIADLMKDKKIQHYTKELIVQMWAKNNASLQGIEQFVRHTWKFPRSRFEELHTELSKRLKTGYNPIIYSSFAPTDDIAYNIHVVQAVGITPFDKKNKTFDLYVWDDGVLKEFFGPFDPEKLFKVIRFRADGSILWLESLDYMKLPLNKNDAQYADLLNKKLIDETFWIDLLPNDDLIMDRLVKNKLNWCKSKPELRKYCF